MDYFAQSFIEQYSSQQPDTLNPQNGSSQSSEALSGQVNTGLSAPGSATELLNSSSKTGVQLGALNQATLSGEFDTTAAPSPSNAPVIVGAIAIGVIIAVVAYLFVQRKA